MKTVEKQQINLKDVQGAFCSWKDCPRITDGLSLPDGWRVVVLARGSLLDFENLMRADREWVLCEKHFEQLDALLK